MRRSSGSRGGGCGDAESRFAAGDTLRSRDFCLGLRAVRSGSRDTPATRRGAVPGRRFRWTLRERRQERRVLLSARAGTVRLGPGTVYSGRPTALPDRPVALSSRPTGRSKRRPVAVRQLGAAGGRLDLRAGGMRVTNRGHVAGPQFLGTGGTVARATALNRGIDDAGSWPKRAVGSRGGTAATDARRDGVP